MALVPDPPRRSFHLPCHPHRRVQVAAIGCVSSVGGCPTIGAGLYLPPVFVKFTHVLRPKRSFHCQSTLRVTVRPRVRWPCWWPSNDPCWDRISRRCSHSRSAINPPRRSFRCQSILPVTDSASGRVGRAGSRPTIRARVISPAGIQKIRKSLPPQTIISLPVHTACGLHSPWAHWSCWWPSSYPCWDCISRRC
jgi:hypothetical protein